MRVFKVTLEVAVNDHSFDYMDWIEQSIEEQLEDGEAIVQYSIEEIEV